jgi:hypothetical protein
VAERRFTLARASLSLSVDINLNMPKDTYDYSCFVVLLD